MFRRKDDERSASDGSNSSDETAYEDNWYRSLRAMSERRRQEPTPLEAGFPVEASAEAEEDRALPPALETSAGQLLERLRALQHIGDPEPAPGPDDPSA